MRPYFALLKIVEARAMGSCSGSGSVKTFHFLLYRYFWQTRFARTQDIRSAVVDAD